MLPNFFIVGAPKCGTTSLAEWLGTHPEIFMSPIKEPRFFSADINAQEVRSWDEYRRLFHGVLPQHRAVGEASTTYLFSKHAVPWIERTIPDARYIILLRNPVEMAYSLHEQQLRSGNEEQKDFAYSWRLIAERRAGYSVPDSCKDPVLLDYAEWCKLGSQVGRVLDTVPRQRCHVALLDDFKRDARKEYLRVLTFLGVADDGRIAFPVHNPAHEWRSPRAARALRRLAYGVARGKHVLGILPKRSFGLIDALFGLAARVRERPKLSAEMRDELADFFAADIGDLERHLGRSLDMWRAG